MQVWWRWLASASFIGYFVFLHLSIYYERHEFGVSGAVGPGGVFAGTVLPGGTADRLGVKVGDRFISMNGLRLNGPNDFPVAIANEPVGVAGEWLLERDGQQIRVATPPMHRGWVRPSIEPVLVSVVLALSLILGLAILWRGPPDMSGRLGAWLLMSFGCVFLPLFPNSFAVLWRDLPIPLMLLLAPATLSSTVVHLILLGYCARMAGTGLSRTQLAIGMIPGLAVEAMVIWYVTCALYAPQAAVDMWMPIWFNFAGPLAYPAYFVASAWLLFAGLRRTTDATERRRLQTLLTGIGSGATGLVFFAIMLGMARTGTVTFSNAAFFGAVGFFTLLPLSFAYATLRHRLFDLRVVVRLGLQYALARGFILAVIPIMIAALLIDALLHGDQPLQAILAERGWGYAAVVAIAIVIFFKRTAWMDAIDRRFFRERYAAQQILREVVEDIGKAANFDTAARKVVGRIDSALHPVMTAVMMRPRTATAFSATAKFPDSAPVSALLSGTAITQVVRALGRPVVFGTQGLRDIPVDQHKWLMDSHVEVVVPVAVDSSRDEAVLVLGPRKSEEPYSREDLDLLATIGASLGLLMGRAPVADGQTVTGEVQPVRRLANRYRIDRPIGEGGMGMVFAATDETLERQVAIKVIKDQHIASGDGLARFQREARTAASLSHAHIVTVHDFGTDDAGFPFLVMELLEGRSLRTDLANGGRMPAPRATAILSGLVSAVEAAHAKGVIHRDLKPENVFLTSDTHAKILDYGIAKAVSATTFSTPGGVLGTLAYMSPEQAAGGNAKPSWDVWALSVIAFEMLSGQHPFGGGLPIARAVSLKTLAPDLPAEMCAGIDRALSHTPSERPSSAAELMRALAPIG